MKDRIFIAWSGSKTLALKVKDVLENRCNYKCLIGGNDSNDSSFSSVGDTVLQQIKSCNQAIVIFQNKADGSISNNLFFELGYSLATYGQPKVHCVRKVTEAINLPSDFDNSFIEPIADGDEDTLVGGIVRYFLERQKMTVSTNKMQLIDNRYVTHDLIQRHFSEQGSRCSDFELAQYMLFYMLAANMFGDADVVQREIINFKQANRYNFSKELALSVDIALAYFDLVLNIRSTDEGKPYIDKQTYHRMKERYSYFEGEVSEDNTALYAEWTRVFIYNHENYGNSLYSECPDLSEERRQKIAKRSLELADKALAEIDGLQKDLSIRENNDHIGLLSLIKAYVYRNNFLACALLGDSDDMKWLELTKKERVSLKKHFEYGSIDTHLSDSLEMEYYLMLVEYLQYADRLNLDEDDEEIYREEIAAYLERMQQKAERSKYVNHINSVFKSLGAK